MMMRQIRGGFLSTQNEGNPHSTNQAPKRNTPPHGPALPTPHLCELQRVGGGQQRDQLGLLALVVQHRHLGGVGGPKLLPPRVVADGDGDGALEDAHAAAGEAHAAACWVGGGVVVVMWGVGWVGCLEDDEGEECTSDQLQTPGRQPTRPINNNHSKPPPTKPTKPTHSAQPSTHPSAPPG